MHMHIHVHIHIHIHTGAWAPSDVVELVTRFARRLSHHVAWPEIEELLVLINQVSVGVCVRLPTPACAQVLKSGSLLPDLGDSQVWEGHERLLVLCLNILACPCMTKSVELGVPRRTADFRPA